MIENIREFCKTPAGGVVVAVVVLIGLYFAYESVHELLTSEAGEASQNRMFMDAATGKSFSHSIHPSDRVPIKAPSGENTGYPAELCYWTKDGTIKKDPTYVLLNQYKSPPEKGPTFCPDCGRLVRPKNPPPYPGMTPPPTKAEYRPETDR